MNLERSTQVKKTSQSNTFLPSNVLQRKCACGNHTPAGGECTTCAKKKVGLQRKLSIGASNDPLELEADRVAEQVMRMPESQTQPKAYSSCNKNVEEGLIQTKPLADRITPIHTRQIEKDEVLQTKEVSGQSPGYITDVQNNIDNLTGTGKPLPESERSFFEPRFGYDFSQVRLHTNSIANQTAQKLNAKAFTLGNSIVFNANRYKPATQEGQRLLAHELTHTIQQSGAYNRSNLATSNGERAVQRKPENEVIEDEEQIVPDQRGEESFIAGNSMDFVKGDIPAETGFAESVDIPKSPKGKAKSKFGGPLGPVEEGMGGAAGALASDCEKWIKISRTTYGYDPSKSADPVEKAFIETYKNFKEGVPIAKPGDFNKKLKKATATPCTCLEKLNVDGHGGSWSGGVQEFAPRKYASLGKRSFGIKKGAGGKLVPFNFHIFNGITFCKPCTITLGGCYVAINTPKPEAGKSGIKGAGDALGEALAKKSGCSVKAYTGLTTTPKAGEFKGGGKGKWVVTKPKKKV